MVFISHNLPQVLEIADRIEVMRLGARVARFRRGEANVEQLIGAISGAYSERGVRHERAPTSATARPKSPPKPRTAGMLRPSRRRRRCSGSSTSPVMVTFGALLVIIIAFSIQASGQFDTASNFPQLAQNVAILTVVSVGTTFVIATAGVDLSIPSGIVLGEVFAVKALGLISVGDGTAVDIDGDQTKAWYILVALCASLLAGLALGPSTASLVGYMRIPPLIATLGTLGAGLGIALLLQNGVNIGDLRARPASRAATPSLGAQSHHDRRRWP